MEIRTAYERAAQFVAAFQMGVGIDGDSVTDAPIALKMQPGPCWEMVDGAPHFVEPDNEATKREIPPVFGPLAIAKVLGAEPRPEDTERAEKFLQRAGFGFSQKSTATAMAHTVGFVCKHWRAIEATARTLFNAGSLSLSDAAAIMERRRFGIFADHPLGERLIHETLALLPESVQAFAAERCRFQFVETGEPGGAFGVADMGEDSADRCGLYVLTYVGSAATFHPGGLVQNLALAFAGVRPNRDGVSPDEISAAAAQAQAWGFDDESIESAA